MLPISLDGLGGDVWGIVKIMFLIGMVVYILFALIVIRQITHMTKTLKVGFEAPLKLLGIIHFIAAIGIFIFALLVL